MNERSDHDPLYYEKLGTDFDKFISDYDTSRRIALILKHLLPAEYLRPGRQVLEIGCGTGRISAVLHASAAKLTVNDISEKLCREVADRIGCAALPGDCAKLACADESFDVVISSECLEHTLKPWEVLKEMRRVLKKDGCLVLTTPNKFWYPALVLARSLKVRKFRGIENWTWPSAMRRWLTANGFTDVHFSGCHLFPWQIPLAKHVLPFLDRWGGVLYPVMINYGFCARKR